MEELPDLQYTGQVSEIQDCCGELDMRLEDDKHIHNFVRRNACKTFTETTDIT
jgi:hypothetical protein